MLTKSHLGQDETRDRQLTRRAALAIARGSQTDKEICRDLQITQGTLDTLRASPLFQELVATYGDEIHERGVKAIVDELMDDAPRNLDFVRSVRDGRFIDKKEKMDLRLRAAFKLLDKQLPNKQDDIGEGAMKVVIGGRLLGQMVRAMKNANAGAVIDVDAEPVPQIPVQTPDEFVEALADAETDD